jgi:hypothetical protein
MSEEPLHLTASALPVSFFHITLDNPTVQRILYQPPLGSPKLFTIPLDTLVYIIVNLNHKHVY